MGTHLNCIDLTIQFISANLAQRVKGETVKAQNMDILVDFREASCYFLFFKIVPQFIYVFFSGPLSSFLIDRYSCRTAVMTSGILLAVGFVGTAFALSIQMTIFTFGIVAGRYLYEP